MSGTVFATFVVVFREALEVSLVLGIILTLLTRLNARRYYTHVFFSALAALIFSFVVGTWLSSLAEASQEKAQALIEGSVSLIAAAVLTYMFFWMESQAKTIKSGIESRIETALSIRDDLAIVSLAFFAVLREGAETVLFLKAVAIQSGESASWLGGLSGCGLAVAIVCLIFVGGRQIPLRPLFRGTGFLIVLMAAGLLAYGIHELEEAKAIPAIIYPLYNINGILNDKEGIGVFLKALFGYNGNPSLTEFLAYWSYFGLVLAAAFRRSRPV